MKAKIKSFKKRHTGSRAKIQNSERTVKNKSRKQRRKEARKEKKHRRLAYFSGKHGPGKADGFGDISKAPATDDNRSAKKPLEKKHALENSVKEKHAKDQHAKDQLAKDQPRTEMNMEVTVSKVKTKQGAQMNRVQTESKSAGAGIKSNSSKSKQEKQKDWASEREELELKRLEKLLKLNTKNKKSLPSSFAADGLDYILSAVDGKILTDSESGMEDSSPKTKKHKDLETGWDDLKPKKRKLVRFADEASNSDADSSDAPSELDKHQKKVPADSDTDSDNKDDSDDDENSTNDNENVSDDDENSSNDDENVSDEDETEEPLTQHNKGDGVGRSDAHEERKHQIKEAVESGRTEKRKKKQNKQNVLEDIYGRLVDETGKVICSTAGAGDKYIPPAKRAALMLGHTDGAQCERLRKQMKGLLNRASESNMKTIASGMEELYMNNSRADVNESLFALIMEACTSEAMMPERLVSELVMLVAILHNNVGSEVGAFFLQKLVKKIEKLKADSQYGEGHTMDNMLLLLSGLYNFKVTAHILLFDVLKWLVESFLEKDVELILLVLKSSGFNLRRDDPEVLGHMITEIQKKAHKYESPGENVPVRMRFMLEVLMAIRNNNMRKVPGIDMEMYDRMRRAAASCIRDGGLADNQLKTGLADLLKADEAGRWWVVGSAWDGHKLAPSNTSVEGPLAARGPSWSSSVSQKLVDLAKKLHMNSDLRRSIFFILMTSEDYQDAFQKVLLLAIKGHQEREIVVVAVECCKAESQYNPYYSFFLARLVQHDRHFLMALQFYMWDAFKVMETLSRTARHNLARMLSHQVACQALPLSVLKVLEFGALDRHTVTFLRTMLTDLLTSATTSDLEAIFLRVGGQAQQRHLAEGLRLFLEHFLRTNKRNVDRRLLSKHVALASAALGVHSQTVL